MSLLKNDRICLVLARLATGDASSLGISSVYRGSVPGSTGVVAHGEASLGTDLATKIYHTTTLYKHTDEIKAQISERVAPGSGGYSYRQLTGSWTHTLVRSCKQTQRIKLAGRANLSGGLNEESNFGHDILVDCFNVDLNGGIVASAAGAGNSVPFFLQATVGGSDVNSTLTLPSYSDMRYRAPNAEFATVTLHRLIPTPWGLPLEAVLRTDTGKVALRRDDLAINHMRHSYSAGVAFKVGNLSALYLLWSWGGNQGGHFHALANPLLTGSSLSSFW